MKQNKRILVAPLNWGLGHATRCIPIIRCLLRHGAEVVLASDGRSLQLLKEEFPELPAYPLPAYDVKYYTANMFLNMGIQFPKIFRAVYKEHKFIDNLISKLRIDAVISDNRYGCYSKKVKSIFLTHQINLIIPIPIFEKIARYFNHRMIRHFDECWIPDFEESPNLSGKLSHDVDLPNLRYLGPLSRMKEKKKNDVTYDMIVVLSGPEPQRTFLEKLLLEQAKQSPLKFLFIQGKPENKSEWLKGEKIRVISFLASDELEEAIHSSKIMISRSGYSTLMDLYYLRKNAILIPTPGQTEQEYLADHFLEQRIFYSHPQKEFNLSKALELAKQFKGFEKTQNPSNSLEKAIDALLQF
ncbi:MAG: UDP-N-acetylglucosamine--N-acetylmuramyl-(pentapeptide) pyrophosphoryl-undecaprenol N-acetylglucosamine transferase [Bacteroidetes bacterium]|nr:UDP-N-acetylglucosamine--N-acetylmuramyl-(pentapeptide) pyrophosphoryl-undecaprenol N-acetylglucosamine transferase [Bacteroidota bacterium]